MVSPKCSVEADVPPGVSSSLPSCAIRLVWLPCGWNGWLSTPTLIILTRAGALPGSVGWTRTSDPYGWLGSNPDPLSWMVSGNSRPLIAK